MLPAEDPRKHLPAHLYSGVAAPSGNPLASTPSSTGSGFSSQAVMMNTTAAARPSQPPPIHVEPKHVLSLLRQMAAEDPLRFKVGGEGARFQRKRDKASRRERFVLAACLTLSGFRLS